MSDELKLNELLEKNATDLSEDEVIFLKETRDKIEAKLAGVEEKPEGGGDPPAGE